MHKCGSTYTPSERDREAVSPRPATHVEGIVLAGVHSWGQCALERELCRPLFPVVGVPVIGHALNWLRTAGVQRAQVCANGDTGAIRAHLGQGEQVGLALDYVEDRMPRGPAGCARDAADKSSADVFVVVEGTVVPQVDLEQLLAAHRESGAALTIVAAVSSAPAVADDETERQECLEPVGVYVASRAALSFVPQQGYQDIKEGLIPRLHKAGECVRAHVVDAFTPRVADTTAYLAVNEWAVERLVAQPTAPAGYVRIGEALIHESARLHDRVRFVGPVVIGPHCHLEADAIVVGPTAMGAGCVIGARAVVSRSVLWTSCKVGAGAIVDHCVMADGAAAEADVVLRETVAVAERPSAGLRGLIQGMLNWRGSRTSQ